MGKVGHKPQVWFSCACARCRIGFLKVTLVVNVGLVCACVCVAVSTPQYFPLTVAEAVKDAAEQL